MAERENSGNIVGKHKTMSAVFSNMTEKDLPFVRDIYNYYILNTTAIYFTKEITTEDVRKIIPINDAKYRSFIIKNDNGEYAGFCYFARFKEREAFSISVEVTIYIHPDYKGKGFGKQALTMLEKYIKEGNFSNSLALVDSENAGSIRLFEKNGYSCCGEIKNVAEKFGRKLTLNIYQKQI